MSETAGRSPATMCPRHGWIGLILVLCCWPINWILTGARTHILFFPLWLGYCLTVDALTRFRTGTSMIGRNTKGYVALFIISAPAWWLFELINLRTQNWHYLGRHLFTDLDYFFFASLSFSTVMPAVFSTAELMRSFAWPGKIMPGWRPVLSRVTWIVLWAGGCSMLVLLLLWPRYFYPMVWASLFLIIEPINYWLGGRTLLGRGDWSSLWALGGGCLICGFFWEMWNVLSYPKWIYIIPFVDFLHLFEMPLPGYLGYPVFALELFALYQLVIRCVQGKGGGGVILPAPER